MEQVVGTVNYIVFFAITAGTYAILALGLNVQWGNTGLFNIGIAGFYALGAYTSALICGVPPSAWEGRTFGGFQLPFIVGLLGAAIVCGVVAMLVGAPTLRLRTDYLAIATIGIAETIRLVLNNESWLTNGVWGFQQIPSPLYKTIHGAASSFLHSHPNLPTWIHDIIAKSYDWFYLGLVLLVLLVLYCFMERLIHSPWGRVVRAIREDECNLHAREKRLLLQDASLGPRSNDNGDRRQHVCSLCSIYSSRIIHAALRNVHHLGNAHSWGKWQQ
jgi:branched-chain amino acid transport system permease protein